MNNMTTMGPTVEGGIAGAGGVSSSTHPHPVPGPTDFLTQALQSLSSSDSIGSMMDDGEEGSDRSSADDNNNKNNHHLHHRNLPSTVGMEGRVGSREHEGEDENDITQTTLEMDINLYLT